MKPNDKEDYDKYIHKIFSQERKTRITQNESIIAELEDIQIADDNYNENPQQFKAREFNSLPDVIRCTFIRKNKNKYKRCGNKIMNDDNDVCYKHIDSPNIYWDNYNKILDKLNL